MQSVDGIRPPRFLDHTDEGGEVGVEEDDHYEELCNHSWPGTEGPVVLVVALACGIFAKLALKQTKVPYTVLLTVLGGFLGLLHDIVYEASAYERTNDPLVTAAAKSESYSRARTCVILIRQCACLLLRYWTGPGEASVQGYLSGQLNCSLAQHQPTYLNRRLFARSHLRICFEHRSVAQSAHFTSLCCESRLEEG